MARIRIIFNDIGKVSTKEGIKEKEDGQFLWFTDSHGVKQAVNKSFIIRMEELPDG